MKNKITGLILALSLAFFGCSGSDDGNGPTGGGGGGGQQVVQATYRITFTPNFTDQSHPTDYPANPGFGPMMVVAHPSTVSVFREGLSATEGLEMYAEDGVTSQLEVELNSVPDTDLPTIRIGSQISADASDFIDIVITPNTTRLSFIAKLSPSPDWFVGVDSFNLVNPDNTLVAEFELTLLAYDAGTDGGTTYDSADVEESGAVQVVSGDPFVNPATSSVSRFGTLHIERTDDPVE
ncbi:MAG: spondin domain-containing protein [Bacteroidia bacterium]|nr:spondin domain-containing protein [Bacteroidia bacterium]MBT8268208.1 spondin domain-containing protein [Bacteroidia bacterium]NNF82608.1 hypothetical protein [Flavobacteriaceae bacterium]NNK68952.1 hypothetical protein [Flavobacteriaceae bacterium]NNL80108.1 hypothetical protein [Flavobacteriaceae bacterium]